MLHWLVHLSIWLLLTRPLLSDSETSQHFLEWLVGFTEGDGSFIVTTRGGLMFVITQSTADVQVLQYIRDVLGFGSVIVQSQANETSRFLIQDQANLFWICLLFNGNLVFPMKQIRFLNFLNAFNALIQRGRSALPFIWPLSITVMPTLQQAWIQGLTDSEGCFTVSLLGNSNAFRIRLIFSQKWDENQHILIHIGLLFGVGTVVPHSNVWNWELRINGLSNCTAVFDYFARFPLKTKKGNS